VQFRIASEARLMLAEVRLTGKIFNMLIAHKKSGVSCGTQIQASSQCDGLTVYL